MAWAKYPIKRSKSKYGNSKATIDGIIFDSKKEAKRYTELAILEKMGVISNLQMQVEYELIPAQYEFFERLSKTGKVLKPGRKCLEKKCSYIADFVYFDNDSKAFVVEDTKGFRTPEYIIKRKMMLYKFGIKIKEV